MNNINSKKQTPQQNIFVKLFVKQEIILYNNHQTITTYTDLYIISHTEHFS